jgi:hypothetical protein
MLDANEDGRYIHIHTYIYIHTYIHVQAFEMLDANEDGRVSRKELRHGLMSIDLLPQLGHHEKAAEALARFVDMHLEAVCDMCLSVCVRLCACVHVYVCVLCTYIHTY